MVTSASSGRASSRAAWPRRARDRGRRLRPRLPHALLDAALGGRPAARRRLRGSSRAYRHFLIRATTSPLMARLEGLLELRLPEEPDPLRARSARPARRGAPRERDAPAAHLLRRLPRQHELRRPGGLPLVPGPRARAPRPRGRRAGRPALPGADALRPRRHAAPEPAVLGQVVPQRPPRAAAAAEPAARPSSRSTSTSSPRAGWASCPSPSPSACAPSAPSRRGSAPGERFDLVHDVQCLGYGLLGVRALGAPGRDDRAPSAHGRPARLLRPRPDAARGARHDGVLPGRHAGLRGAAPRPRLHLLRGRAGARSSATSACRPRACACSATASTPSCFRPDPALPRSDRRDRSASGAPRIRTRASAR